MAKNDGKPDIQDVLDGQEAETIILWAKAALVRAIKTIAQSAVAAIPTSAVTIGSVDWRLVAGTGILAGILSLFTSVAGIPEVDDGNDIGHLTPNTPQHAA